MKHPRGLAILETAIFLAVLGALTMGAIGTFEYLRAVRLLHKTVDKHLHDMPVRSHLLDARSGTVELTIHHAKLGRAVNMHAQACYDELAASLTHGSATSTGAESALFVEFAYATVAVSSDTGAVHGEPAVHHRAFWGSPALVAEVPSASSLLAAYIETSRSPGGLRLASSLHPLPHAYARPHYAPEFVLVAARSVFDLSDTVAGKFLRLLNRPAIAVTAQVAAVRSEVG